MKAHDYTENAWYQKLTHIFPKASVNIKLTKVDQAWEAEQCSKEIGFVHEISLPFDRYSALNPKP